MKPNKALTVMFVLLIFICAHAFYLSNQNCRLQKELHQYQQLEQCYVTLYDAELYKLK